MMFVACKLAFVRFSQCNYFDVFRSLTFVSGILESAERINVKFSVTYLNLSETDVHVT